MSLRLVDLLLQSLGETLEMTAAAGLIALAVGLPLAVVLVATDRAGILPAVTFNRLLGTVVTGFRSIPFIILLVALIPLTRLIVGTSIGTEAAIMPLAIAATPCFARIAEV